MQTGGIMKEKTKKTYSLITLWIVLGVAIVLGNFVFSFIIGGSAMNGYVESGSYFIISKFTDDLYIEVSKTIWIISKVWGFLFYIFIPLTPIGAFVISSIQEKIERRKNRLE